MLDVDIWVCMGNSHKKIRKKGFFDLHKTEESVCGETGLNKKDQQIDELDQAENKLPFICAGKQMKHQSVR